MSLALVPRESAQSAVSARLSCGSGRADADADVGSDNIGADGDIGADNIGPDADVRADNIGPDADVRADIIGPDGWVAALYAYCGTIGGTLGYLVFARMRVRAWGARAVQAPCAGGRCGGHGESCWQTGPVPATHLQVGGRVPLGLRC